MSTEEIRAYMKEIIERSGFPPSCATPSELADYIGNACDAATKESIQAHLVGCPECRSTLLELAAFVALTSESQTPASRNREVERHWKKLRTRLRVEELPRWSFGRIGWRLSAVSAVCAGIAISWGVFLQYKLHTLEIAHQRVLQQEIRAVKDQKSMEAQIAAMRAPQLNLPVFDVMPVDSMDRSGAARRPRVLMLPSAGRFALVLSEGARESARAYSVTILDEQSKTVFAGEGLKLDNQGNLLITFDRDFLPPGRYRINVKESRPARVGSPDSRIVASYAIRIVDQRRDADRDLTDSESETPKTAKPAQ